MNGAKQWVGPLVIKILDGERKKKKRKKGKKRERAVRGDTLHNPPALLCVVCDVTPMVLWGNCISFRFSFFFFFLLKGVKNPKRVKDGKDFFLF